MPEILSPRPTVFTGFLATMTGTSVKECFPRLYSATGLSAVILFSWRPPGEVAKVSGHRTFISDPSISSTDALSKARVVAVTDPLAVEEADGDLQLFKKKKPGECQI